tara:strand:- start:393 stop:665 length:273 start_codon:yes stop_codon:yes gene_type:complete
MSFKKYFISKSPLLQVGDPLKDLMNKLYTTSSSSSNSNNSSSTNSNNSSSKGKDLSAKYNPNEKGKSGTETLLNTNTSKSTKEEIKKGKL